MITNEQEYVGTKDRIAYFERLLAQVRATATPEEFSLVAGGYRAALKKMQEEVVAYLVRPLDQTRSVLVADRS